MTERKQLSESGKVVTLRPRNAAKASERKWGKAVMDRGFCIVPSLLLRAQARLKLSPTQLAILMHLADYWWDVDRKPWPKKQTLGDRLNLSARQVQRYIAELEEMGYVKRIERTAPHKGKLSNEYDLSGLVERLKQLEPEFRQVEEENKERLREVARPGFAVGEVSRPRVRASPRTEDPVRQDHSPRSFAGRRLSGEMFPGSAGLGRGLPALAGSPLLGFCAGGEVSAGSRSRLVGDQGELGDGGRKCASVPSGANRNLGTSVQCLALLGIAPIRLKADISSGTVPTLPIAGDPGDAQAVYVDVGLIVAVVLNVDHDAPLS